jgi:hypothetical protein
MHYRAAPDAREIELLRAINIEVVRTMDRIRQQHSHSGASEGAGRAHEDVRNEMMIDATKRDASSPDSE